jgi:hypothetical protein
MSDTDCLYTGISGVIVYYVQLLSWVVYFIMFGAAITYDTRRKRWGQQFTLTLFSIWLMVCVGFVYILQYTLNVQRIDPFCTRTTSLVFPSVPTFYAASGATFVIAFVYVRRVQLPWSKWPLLWALFSGPFMLAVFAVNTWFEVLGSLLLGIGLTLVFFFAMVYLIIPQFPYLLTSAPWNSMFCIDTWFMTANAQRHEDRIRNAIKISLHYFFLPWRRVRVMFPSAPCCISSTTAPYKRHGNNNHHHHNHPCSYPRSKSTPNCATPASGRPNATPGPTRK